MLFRSVHQRTDEHDQAGAGTNLRIGLLGGKDATDAGDSEPVVTEHRMAIAMARQGGIGIIQVGLPNAAITAG